MILPESISEPEVNELNSYRSFNGNKTISSQSRCSRCCLDLRFNKDQGGCICKRSHPLSYSCSGTGIIIVEFEYNGTIQ